MSGEFNRVVYGDCREVLRQFVEQNVKVNCCITSPPYMNLRSYLPDTSPDKHLEIGTESNLADYITALVNVFGLVRDVLTDDGTLWIVIGDSMAGSGGAGGDYGPGGKREGQPRYKGHSEPGLKPKDLMGVPWALAFALREAGWWLRSEIIWDKGNILTEGGARDRCSRNHETVFMLSKSRRYDFDKGAVEDKTVWRIPLESCPENHHAVMPQKLAERCILAGSCRGNIILDPFFGSGTVGMVAERLGRRWLGIELNREYAPIIERRTAQMGLWGQE